MKTFRIPEPEWAQAMFNRLKTMISNLKSSIEGAGYITQETDPTVPAWAKAASKPTYTAQEVGALPANTPIPTKTSDLTNDSGFITQETDPTVPSWAKQSSKPQYTAQEVGALPANTPIPSKTSDLTNDGDGDSPIVTAAEVVAPDMEQAINVLTTEHGGTGSFDETTACDNLGAAHAFVIESYDVQDASDVQIELEDRIADYATSGIVKMDSAVWALFTANTRTGDFVGIISHFNDSPNNYSVFGLEHNDTLVFGQVMIQGTSVYPSLYHIAGS